FGDKEHLAVRRLRKANWIGAAVLLSRESSVEIASRSGIGAIHDSDFVAVGQRNVELLLIRAQKHRGRMRAGLNALTRLAQRNHAANFARNQIKLSYARGVPETDIAGGAILRGRDSIGKAAGDRR